MISMEERVNYLDSIMAELARAQVQTEIAFKASGVRMDALFRKMEADTAKMKESNARLDEALLRMEADTAKMKEDTARMKKDTAESSSRLDEALLRMEADTAKMKEDTARMKKDTAESSSRLDEALLRREAADARMQEDTRRMKQVWGDLANKMGTVAEDVVAPNIPRLALEEFGFSEVEDLMVRARRASRRGEKRQSEWDVVCSGPEKVIVVEVKSTPTRDKIREVPAHLAEFFDFFPEYEGRELIGVFASWAIDPRLLPAISEAGLYGIAMGEDTMDIVARPAGHKGAGAS